MVDWQTVEKQVLPGGLLSFPQTKALIISANKNLSAFKSYEKYFYNAFSLDGVPQAA